jgi:hypothetical protein
MHIKQPETQLSLIVIGFLAYLSLPAFYWWWLKHTVEGDPYRLENWMTAFWMLWFAGMLFIPLGFYFLVRTWLIARNEIMKRHEQL